MTNYVFEENIDFYMVPHALMRKEGEMSYGSAMGPNRDFYCKLPFTS